MCTSVSDVLPKLQIVESSLDELIPAHGNSVANIFTVQVPTQDLQIIINHDDVYDQSVPPLFDCCKMQRGELSTFKCCFEKWTFLTITITYLEPKKSCILTS